MHYYFYGWIYIVENNGMKNLKVCLGHLSCLRVLYELDEDRKWKEHFNNFKFNMKKNR